MSTCDRCDGQLEPKWWQDVPGEGNLCDACHKIWMAEQARKLDKGKPRGETR